MRAGGADVLDVPRLRRRPDFAPSARSAASSAREDAPGTWGQDCETPPGCPDPGLDPSRCLTDPTPFRPTFLDGQVVSVSVDEATIAGLALAPGTWWAAWSDGIACEQVVATFVVAEPEVTP